jgi:hypothetical protein
MGNWQIDLTIQHGALMDDYAWFLVRRAYCGLPLKTTGQ